MSAVKKALLNIRVFRNQKCLKDAGEPVCFAVSFAGYLVMCKLSECMTSLLLMAFRLS